MTKPKPILWQLIEANLDADLENEVRLAREAGQSWRAIALAISARSGTNVSYEALRRWFE